MTTAATEAPAGDAFLSEEFHQKIDLDEFHSRQVDLFFFIDADKNGFLVAAELDPRGAEAIEQVYHDKSGSHSLAEFLELRTHAFLSADKDDDGNLTLQEVASGSR